MNYKTKNFSIGQLANQGIIQSHLARILNGGLLEFYRSNLKSYEFYQRFLNDYLRLYLPTHLEKLDGISLFTKFLKLCARHVGQLVNVGSIAQECGVSLSIAKVWFDLLEKSNIVFLLQPYLNGANKKISKMPKLYFYDTGLACFLLGVKTEKDLLQHPFHGSLFENLVILELKYYRELDRGINLYFWRDFFGHEVDCVLENNGVVYAIEIKSSTLFHSNFLKNLHFFKELLPNANTVLIYDGHDNSEFEGTRIVTLSNLAVLFA